MARTFEERKREQAAGRSERRPGFEGGEWFPEVSGSFDGELLQEKFAELMDILRPAPGEGRRGDITRPDIPGAITAPNLEGLDNTGLLQVIAQTLIEQLNVQIDIANAVEPPTTITVTGTEAIDEADVPQLVVPQSDNGNIPTRTIFIRNDPDNSEKIYFGDDEVVPQDGFVLGVGEYIIFPLDLRESQLWMACEDADEVVQLLGVF